MSEKSPDLEGPLVNIFEEKILDGPNLETYSEEEYDNVLMKLKFIASTQMGEKLDLPSMTTMKNSYSTAIYRTMNGGTRDETFNFIKTTINIATKMLNLNPNFNILSPQLQLKTELLKCIEGLKNIKGTYHDDKGFVCRVEVLADKIRNVIKYSENK